MRADGSRVTFAYDAVGSRTTSTVDGIVLAIAGGIKARNKINNQQS